MRKTLPLLVLAAMPALLLSGCSGNGPDIEGYTSAVIAYTDLNGPALSTGQPADLRKVVLGRGMQTCALLGKGASTALASTRLAVDSSRRSGGDSEAQAAFQWYELDTAAEYLCPEHAALAKRVAAGIPGFGNPSSESSGQYSLSFRPAETSAAGESGR